MASKEALAAVKQGFADVKNSLKSVFGGTGDTKSTAGDIGQTGTYGINNLDAYKVDKADASKVKSTATNAASEADRQAYESANTTKQNDIVGQYANNPALWGMLDPNWQNPHANNNFRGNINGRSASNTLQLSRLADAFNSQLHSSPTDIGARSVTGAGISGSGTGIENATPKRWDSIETQEMRQMRNNEQLDKYQRQQDIDREAKLRGHSLNLQEQADKSRSSIAEYSAKTGIDFENALRKAVIDSEYTQNNATRYSNILAGFANELQNSNNDRVTGLIAKNIKNGTWTKILGQIYARNAVMPGLDNLTRNWWQQYVLSSMPKDLTPQEQAKYIAESMSMYDSQYLISTAEGAFNTGKDAVFNAFSPSK